MSKFNKGDRVLVKSPTEFDIENGYRVGDEYMVNRQVGSVVFVDFAPHACGVYAKDLELVEQLRSTTPTVENDPVNHPSHYTVFGAEVIDITEHLSFNRGNAIKYFARAGLKDPATELEDLKKGRWYADREIALVEKRLGL